MTNITQKEWILSQDISVLEDTLDIIIESDLLTFKMEDTIMRCAARISYSRNPESAKKASRKHYEKVMRIYRENKDK